MAESGLKMTITNAKVDVKEFDDQNNFGLWHSDMKDKRGNVTSKRILKKSECAFCHEEGHWKKACPKLKNKYKSKSMSNACVIDFGGDSSDSKFCLVGHQTIAGFD